MPRALSDFLWELESEALSDSQDRFANLDTDFLLSDLDQTDGVFSLPLTAVDLGVGSELSLV